MGSELPPRSMVFGPAAWDAVRQIGYILCAWLRCRLSSSLCADSYLQQHKTLASQNKSKPSSDFKKESPDTKFVQGASGPPCICPEIPKRLSTSLCRQPCTRRRCLFVRTQKPLPNTIDLCGRSERMSIGTPKNLPATFLRIYPAKRGHLHIRSSPCITKQK